MKYRRFEFIGMVAVVLVLNLLFSAWWLSGNAVPTAWAGPLNQERRDCRHRCRQHSERL